MNVAEFLAVLSAFQFEIAHFRFDDPSIDSLAPGSSESCCGDVVEELAHQAAALSVG